MNNYLARRLLLVPVTVFLLSAFVFAMLRAVPGSVVEGKLGDNYTPEQADALAKKYGFDDPVHVQYVKWVSDVLRGDLGTSLVNATPIADEFTRRFPVTLELLLLTMIIQVPLGIGLGVVSATRQNRPEDLILRVVAILFLAVPSFWLATLVIILPLLWWNYSLPSGYVDIWVDPITNFKQMIAPAAVAGTAGAAILMRATRSYLLEVLRQDYIRTAQAKGVRWRVVVLRHALRNAFIPLVTIIGLSFASSFGGSVIAEQIFSLPGLGQYIVSAIVLRDYPIIQTFVIFFGTVFVVVNLIVDMTYVWLDPRVGVS